MASGKVRNLVVISLLAATSFILMYVLQIPYPAAPYLKWDPSDLPNVLGGFILGPAGAIAISLIKSILFLIFKGSEGPIGAAMAFFSGAALAAGAGLVYRRWPNRYGVLGGLVAGTLALVTTMALLNYYWALGAWGIPEGARLATVKAIIFPFNLWRGVLSSLIIYPVYLALRRPLARWLN